MLKIGICGHFGGNKTFLDGQTVKTKIITQELKKIYSLKRVDTYNSKKRIFNILFGLIKLLAQCKNIIILPAHNGLKIIAPFLVFFNKIFKRKLHYIVIGGWLSKYLEDKESLKECLKKFDYIYVETSTMKKALENKGFKNIVIMPNCKDLKILKEEELVYNTSKPYKLCTFSRVVKEKGIEDAIEAVKSINENSKEIIYTLDIYGQIDEDYKERFENLAKGFPEYIKYKGLVPFDKSVDVLKEYYILLFPTYYQGEGLAGTLIDSMSAGVPIVASDWRYNKEVINSKNGFIFETRNMEKFIDILYRLSLENSLVNKLKSNCLKEAIKFDSKQVIKNNIRIN